MPQVDASLELLPLFFPPHSIEEELSPGYLIEHCKHFKSFQALLKEPSGTKLVCDHVLNIYTIDWEWHLILATCIERAYFVGGGWKSAVTLFPNLTCKYQYIRRFSLQKNCICWWLKSIIQERDWESLCATSYRWHSSEYQANNSKIVYLNTLFTMYFYGVSCEFKYLNGVFSLLDKTKRQLRPVDSVNRLEK